MKGQTKLVTPVYTKPSPTKSFLALQLLAFREITINKVQIFVNPYDGNKEEIYKFGKTPGGWLLMQHDNVYYFEEDACPTCLCGISGEVNFKLPCCQNKIHLNCFQMQIKSFKGGLWSESHITCPYCRENYFEGEGRNDNQYFWTNYEPLYSVFNHGEHSWDEYTKMIRRNFRNHKLVKELKEEKDKEVPEEERGGWAVQMCDLCKGPSIRGKLSCAEEMNLDLDAPFVCSACEWGAKEAKDHRCFLHGKKYAMFKCDSCCSPATWDCWSNHYCNRCHDMAGATKHFPCPGQDKCPLGIAHPKNSHGRHGEGDVGFVVGCFKCVDPNYEVNSSYNENAPDPFRAADLENENNLSMFRYSAPPKVKPVAESLPVVPEAPVEPEAAEVEYDSPEEEEPSDKFFFYDRFIAGFQNSDAESDSSESDSYEDVSEEIPFAYEKFLAGFHSDSEQQDNVSEEIPFAYEKFVLFSDSSSCSDSESSDSTELAFEEESEEQILPILAPRPMIHNISIDSLLSEDTINLLNFNQGFAPCTSVEDDEGEDVFAPYPIVMTPSQPEVVMV